MAMRIYLLLIAFSLSACDKIEVNDAGLVNTEDLSINRIQIKTLDSKTRQALNAMNPDDLIAVFTDDGISLYGAPGKDFRVVPKEQLDSKSMDKSKIDGKGPGPGPVNSAVINTFVSSPACQEIKVAGYRFWYPSNCP